jgi:hypothetical protein
MVPHPLLEEGVAGVGRVSPPRGRRWVGRRRRRSRSSRVGSRAHPRLHRVPVVREDEPFEHLAGEVCVSVELGGARESVGSKCARGLECGRRGCGVRGSGEGR